jgi:hypothetical protein
MCNPRRAQRGRLFWGAGAWVAIVAAPIAIRRKRSEENCEVRTLHLGLVVAGVCCMDVMGIVKHF